MKDIKKEIKKDFDSLSYYDFVQKYISTPIKRSEPVAENEVLYFYDEDNYFEVIEKYQYGKHYVFDNDEDKWKSIKWKDGECRRSKFEKSISYIHQIKPDIEFADFAAQCVNYFMCNIDNHFEGDKISNDYIWKHITNEYEQPKKFKSLVCKKFRIKKTNGVHYETILKQWKKEICIAMYDNRLSLEANIEEINDYVKTELFGVFEINIVTLKRYLKEEGLPVKKIDEVKMLYNNGELTLDILETYKDCIGINQYYSFKKLVKNS